MRKVSPLGALIEEASIDLLASATRNGPTIDGRDWSGSTQANFGTRKFGFPILDLCVRPANGNVNVNVQFGLPTFPIAEPPVLAFTTFQTVGALVGAWTPLTLRVTTRFWRVQLEDTSGAANDAVYLVYFVRSQ